MPDLPQITVSPDGPYLVSGGLVCSELIMVSGPRNRVYLQGRVLTTEENYALCRCGHTQTPPFCDGSHLREHFEGAEVASRAPYAARMETFDGPTLLLEDDHRCSYARFCHRWGMEVWTLTDLSDNPELRAEAIQAALDCPSGRLQHRDKLQDNQVIEERDEPGIFILQDPDQRCSAGILVRGNVPLVSADGETYEIRPRYTLCHCGLSNNKPFCDATHVSLKWFDGL